MQHVYSLKSRVAYVLRIRTLLDVESYATHGKMDTKKLEVKTIIER